MQPYPPDNPRDASGVPLYVIPTSMRAGNLVIQEEDVPGSFGYLDDLYKALGASNVPISQQYGAVARQLLDLARQSINEGAVYQCAMGDVEILFVPTTLDGRPWYYFQWETFITPSPRPKRTAEENADLQQKIHAAATKRQQDKDALQAEADLWYMCQRHPSEFTFDARNLYWLEQLASGLGRYALGMWLKKHPLADYNTMLAKVRMATLSVAQLKTLLKANGLPTKGNKPGLVRLAQSLPTEAQRAYLEATP